MYATLSCGILVIAMPGDLLLCHATGTRRWDIPKGGGEPGETPLAVAIRETREECGLAFAPDALLDLGAFTYRPGKDLHLFAGSSERIDPRSCTCSSTFVDAKRATRPEMDAFRWAPFAELGRWCAPSMTAVLMQRIELHGVLARLTPALAVSPLRAPRST